MLPKTPKTVLPHLRVREKEQTQSIKHKNCNLGLIEFIAKPYPAMKERTELEESNSKSTLVEDFSVLKLSSRYSIRVTEQNSMWIKELPVNCLQNQ